MRGVTNGRRSGRWIALALAVGASVAGLATTAAPGRHAQPFSFEDINPASPSHGRTLALADLYSARGLVLQFVASWCKPCRDELPVLETLHRRGGTPVVLVAADEYGYTEGLLLVAQRSGLTTPILFVPAERAQELEQHYDHEILPATYLVDRAGAILEVHEGAWPASDLATAIERHLPATSGGRPAEDGGLEERQ